MLSKIPKDIQIDISDENLLRLGLLTRKLGLKYGKQIIFTYFPKDPVSLYNALVAYQSNLRNLFQDQHQILFGTPSLGTDIDKCDLTLLGKIVKLKNDPNSNTIKDLLKIRNWIAHYGSKPLKGLLFNQKFNEIKGILKNLGASDGEVEHFRHARIDNSKEIMEDLLKDIRNEIPRSIILQEALDIVSKHIEGGWRNLAISLDVHPHIVDSIAQQMVTNEEKMNKCFEHKSFNISWNFLKQQLIKQNHSNIIEKIVKETYITAGLKEFSNVQREHYKSKLGKVQRTDPLSNMPFAFVTREEEYVNLYMSNDFGKTDAMVNSDHMFNLTNQFRLRKKIDLKDILKDDDDDFILIRGIGGIGKSTLADMLVLKWSKGEHLKEIKLLFYVKCREIEELDQNTLKDFLTSHFTLLTEGPNLDDITEIGKHVLLVFDGFDELENCKVSKINRMLMDNFKLQSANFRVCVTGRPKSIQSLRLNVEGSKKLIDVMGFTPENQISFIEHYYKEHEDFDTKVVEMIENIKLNSELKSLATIPLYLRVLCYINDHRNGFDYVNSTVSLYLVMCLFIIQKCYKNLGLSNADLYTVAREKKVVQILLKLARLSYSALKNSQVVFSETDFSENIADLEKSGFLIKYGTKKGFNYQFQHLIFSEFLCGLYLFSKGRKVIDLFRKFKSESPVWNCLPTLIALHTAYSNSQSSFENDFLLKVVKVKKSKFLNGHNIESLLLQLFDIQNFIPKTNFTKRKPQVYDITFDDSWLLLLQCIYESQQKVPTAIVNAVVKARLVNLEISYHHQLHYLTSFFEGLSGKETINKLTLDLIDDNLSDKEVESLGDILVRCKGIMVNTQLNTKVFLSTLTDPNSNGFHNLKHLLLLSTPTQCHHVMGYVPYLREFALNCQNISVESVQLLSHFLQESKAKKEILLETLFLYRCPEQLIQYFLPCISCIPSLAFFECALPIPTLEVISKTVEEAAINSNFKCLGFQFCHINNAGVQALSSCFSHITELCLEDNPDISEIGLQAVVDSILQQVQSNGKPTLQILHLSHLNKNLIKTLLPAVSYLSHLDLLKSEIGVDDIKELKKATQPRKDTFLMKISFDGNINIDKNVIKELVSNAPIDVNYKSAIS